jgi:hypothetical protein
MKKKGSSKGSAAARKAHKTRKKIGAARYESEIAKRAAERRKQNMKNKEGPE